MGRRVRKRSNHFYKDIRKKERMYQKLTKDIDKNRRINQCDCLHTDANGPDVRIFKREGDEIIFECRICKKLIYANRVPDKMIASSLKATDMMCDTVKMNLNIRNKKDVEVANWISEYQQINNHQLKNLYLATVQTKQQKKSSVNFNNYGKSSISRR